MWKRSGFGTYRVTTKNQPTVYGILDISISYGLNRETPNIKNTCSPGLLNICILQEKWYKTLLLINVSSHFCNSEQSMAAMKTFLQQNVCVWHTDLDCNLVQWKSKTIPLCRKAEINSKCSIICFITFFLIINAIFCSVYFFSEASREQQRKKSTVKVEPLFFY